MTDETPWARAVALRAQGLSDDDIARTLREQGVDEETVHVVLNSLKGGVAQVSPPPSKAPTVKPKMTTSQAILSIVGVLVGLVVLLFAGVAIAIKAGACPFLYLDRGQGFELVGVPFAGAMYHSVERDDLLELGSLPEGRARLKLLNAGQTPERDYTNRAELVLVDHAPDVHAVSGPQGELIVAKGAQAPSSAVNLRGRNQLEFVATSDNHFWQTDLLRERAESSPQLREGLEATFPAPQAGSPVLELSVATAPWVEVVFTRWAALFGDELDRYVDKFNQPDLKPDILAWQDQEGMDLRVELFEGAQWQKIAVVPTPGLTRRIAIPLPERHEPVRVRVSGAMGFWRVDSLALSTAVDQKSQIVRTLAPAVATDDSGADQRELLQRADGHYQLLPQPGAALSLEFDVPALERGQVREAFYSSRGYYNLSGIAKGRWSPLSLLMLHYRTGGLSRLSLDLAGEKDAAEALAAVERHLEAKRRLP